MHLKFRNVNEAFDSLVRGMVEGSFPTKAKPSRVGDVLQVEEPVTVTYLRPCERVLFNTARDCNHFFHLFEGLWMLAGSNKVEQLAYYNPKMLDYSDNGETLHGAYGHRWQSWPASDETTIDQLDRICKNWRNPSCRRQVLSVWDAERDLGGDGKDLPCNTHAYFSKREVEGGDSVLDMTVCNRSNDLIWGMLGANAVHWSMLQEYMAARLNVNVGVYNQFTNNLHVYTDQWKPVDYLDAAWKWFWPNEEMKPVPLVQDPIVFMEEVRKFVNDGIDGTWKEPFLATVAQPMMAAFRAHKLRRYYGDNNAIELAERIAADDWRKAALYWLNKRKEKWEAESHERNYILPDASKFKQLIELATITGDNSFATYLLFLTDARKLAMEAQISVSDVLGWMISLASEGIPAYNLIATIRKNLRLLGIRADRNSDA